MRPYAVFYHLGQLGDWEEIYTKHMNLLYEFVLGAETGFWIHVNGNEDLPFVPDRAEVVRNNDHLLEADTLMALSRFCENYPDHDVLYLHSKGVTRFEREERVWDNIVAWTEFMEDCVLRRSSECREKLEEGHPAAGPMVQRCSYLMNRADKNIYPFHTPHFCGNFWWARADHINGLPTDILYEEWFQSGHARFQSERWIGQRGLNNAYDMGGPPAVDVYFMPRSEWEKPVDWQPRICIIVMFANESKVLRRMLDSTLGYGHYYVFQDNGSTDGTDEIARAFLEENNLEGHLYYCEEGWQGFGWNRDHVLQEAKKTDHGCHWIMKMDCDEMLMIEEDFSWQPLRDLSMAAWHILAHSGDTVYDRTWMWNAQYNWRFNHDPAHETIRLDEMKEGHKENFPAERLPGMIHVGTNDGESYLNPFKYINDSVKLEMKGINEGLYNDLYHYWYIGQSYKDAYQSDAFPLGEAQQKEFARRGVWWFEKWMEDFDSKPEFTAIELAYNACISLGEMLIFKLTEYERGMYWLNKAEEYCPGRNEHAVAKGNAAIAFDNKTIRNEAIAVLEEGRPLPIDTYSVFLSRSAYDGGALNYMKNAPCSNLGVGVEQRRRLIVIDNIYQDPYAVRDYALSLDYTEDDRWYKGLRSTTNHQPAGLQQLIERYIGQPIQDWDTQGINGCFQITQSKDQQVYHFDDQRWAGVLYLTPDAPAESGTRLLRSKLNGTRNSREDDREIVDSAFNSDFYDSTKFEVVDAAGNIFNRLILMDANSFHSAGPYFGSSPEEGRLVQLFFFD